MLDSFSARGAGGDQMRRRVPAGCGWPFAPVVIPRRENAKHLFGRPCVDESLADLVAKGMEIGVGDSEFAEYGTGADGIVEIQKFHQMEFDRFALFGNGRRRDRSAI